MINLTRSIKSFVHLMFSVGCLLTAPSYAEDVITTASTTYRGQVLKASLTQVIMQLADGNRLGIPRNSITSVDVKPPARVIEGMKAYQAGNLAAAYEQLKGVESDYAGLDTAWVPKTIVTLGKAAAAAGDNKTADTAYRIVVTAYPESDDRQAAEIGLAGLLLADGKTDLARKAYQELADLYAGQVKPGPELQALAAETYLGLGKAHEAKSDWAEALAAYLNVVVLYPTPAYASEGLLRSAMMQLRLKRPLAAEGALVEITEDYPDSAESARAGQLLQALRKQMAELEQP
ncbi:MAG: tetratricopeptide repeat protein [Kiritimatiellia bacterium]